ncbi:thyrotroph embryonic factor isoform X4 [Diachasma alloeum]|uniref:thyrotroph embryonic factor isoform X4 n=1 Tax=Diachasma alloeum TaxID=454923 RepID=UPI0007382FB3|nr:thyrotroph embryonic factor isoform X4 [Diachasma alloeum]
MSCAMEYQQLVPPPVPVSHQSHHSQQQHPNQQSHHQQAVVATVPPPHPHIVLAPAHQTQQPPPNLPPPTTHAHQVHPPLPSIHDDSTSSRWTQYQHIWRQHHVYMNGKQTKDGPEEKKDADGELWGNVEAQAAFLGPNIWDKTLPYDADLKVLNHYVDLDEFLSENGIPVDGVGGGGQGTMQGSQLHKMSNSSNEATSHQGPAGLHLEPVTKRERSASPSDCCSPDTLNPPSPADSNSGDSSRIQYGLSLVALSMASSGRDFDPRTRAFSDEELKPQPMIKKSRKQFVPDDLKDDKYWARRRKNNMAAKRSRDARRMKENQIALRAGFLEKENMGLRQELDRLKNENMLLRDKLSKYTDG